MRKLFIKFLFLISFILCFAGNVFAAVDLNISSVVLDNSFSVLTINSQDNSEYNFTEIPKIHVLQGENRAYFDINSSILRCPAQDLVISSQDIKEILVKQFSANPNIVRVVFSYNEGFNPYNIQLKKINNTLVVRLNSTNIQSFYFHHIYSDLVNNVGKVFESVNLQIPVLTSSTNIMSQINSAFNLGETTQDKNYILTKKDLMLTTKYNLNNIDIKSGMVHITGVGALTLTKPFTLTNPSRLVYDIPNATVNPTLRNKEIKISQTDTIKVGQFDKNTARIVISSENYDKYLPAVYADAQRLVFIDKTLGNHNLLFSTKTNITALQNEQSTSNTKSSKLVFSKPIIYGIERTNSTIDLYLLNVDRYQDINLKTSKILENAKFSSLKDIGVKLSIPTKDLDTEIDIHVGIDGKTLRIKSKTNKIEPVKPVISTPPKQSITVPKVQPVVDKKIILIDPGHGGSDCGALRNNIREKDITLDVSKRVVTLLQKKGYEVLLTRDSDIYVSLQDRVDISENNNPDIFVSIHVNSSNSETPNGLETHYYKDNSLTLAKTVHASLLNHITAKDRGLFKSKFYVINHTTAPAILIEIGFISNNAERAQLVSESRKQATAKAIAEGIDDYFKE